MIDMLNYCDFVKAILDEVKAVYGFLIKEGFLRHKLF